MKSFLSKKKKNENIFNNVFEPDSEKREILCWIITGMTAVLVIAYFDVITARIAIFVSKLLTSGIPALILGLVILYGLSRLGWRRRRWFW